MTITLTPQDIIIDETAGFQDADVDVTAAPYSTNTTVQYLVGLDGPGGLSPREVAFKTDFVVASASAGETITSLALAQNLGGTPFSTTVGVNSGIRTVDGNYVWLFQDATHVNVVIGVIGTSDPLAEPAESGPLAFAFALISTSSTNADLVTVEYVPLLHPDATNVDDRIDLTDKVFVAATGTTVVNFSQLGDAPPGHNNWYILDADVATSQKILVTAHDNGVQSEVNVSTQGLGVSSQDVRFGRELQIDLITGGTQSAGKNFTDTPTIGPDYTSHIETVSSAGFSISQSTPTNTKADMEIHAYNNNDNAEGAAFPGDDNDAEINITGVTFKLNGVATTAAALGITVDLSGTGLILHNVGEGVTVDFTTAGGAGGTFDRFTIKNIDTEKDYFDVKEVHFIGQSTNAQSKEVGSFINFDDDGPSIDPSQAAVPTLTVDETTFATDASASFAGLFTSDFGNDGFKDADNNDVEDADAISYKLGISANNAASGLTDTLTNESVTLSVNAAGTVVTGSSATGGTVFTITVNADTGEVTLDQVRAVVHDDPADPDESASPAQLSAASLVTLTATIIDGDGDTDTATRNIGDAFKFEDDGPSIDPSQATVPTLTVDETTFATDASASFAGLFTSGAFGNDGFKDTDNNNVEDADAIKYALGISAPNAASGLIDTLTNESVTLSVNAAGTVVTGSSASGGTVFTITVNADTGEVTLDQSRAVVHDDATDPDESASPAQLSAASLVTLTATITDGDGDTDTATRNIGDAFKFEDDGPSIDPSQATVPSLTVDETAFATNASASFAGLFTSGAFGNDGFKDADNNDVEDADAIKYALGISAPNAASGLIDTLTNESVTLSVNAAGTVVTGSSASGGTVFTITVNADTGEVTLDQVRAVVHDDPADPDENTSPAQLSAATLVTLTATITDGDGDTDTATRNIGDAFKFEDDGPTITAAFDADPVAPGVQTPEKLGNAVGQTASGTFGYDLGADAHLAAFYTAGGSDFVDANGTLAGVQISLSGTVVNAQNPNITNTVVTLSSESLTSASFNFSFHYDKDPITAGVQDATAGGTLAFNKTADIYTFTLNDAIDGFSFNVLHTNELLAKQPTGNTGHPLIVAEQLTPNGDPNPFFVQFTGNSTTQQIGFGFNSTGDGAPNGPPTDTSFTQGAHDMVTNVNEDWVSATQATNGVAGDTIQKGELLTLRFFHENILSDVNPNSPGGGTERLDPTTSASGVVIKFDGIGNSEDLVLVLDLKDANGNEITRAVNVENSDLIKDNANVPSPYNTEFTLDNNDALVILEQNDYTVAGETYQIQGIQIMQSANGLTGNAINLNGATGTNGGSSATSNLTAWDAADNDVLKIVDIGFVQQTSGTIDANLDFSFALVDADFDPTATQHLLVNVSNNWIV